MTINKLIKELKKIESIVGKRANVVIDKNSIDRGFLEYSHCGLSEVISDSITWAVNDSTERKDGSERWKTVVVLKGN